MNRTVHLFIPCFVDQFFPQTGMATVKLLEDAGCKVLFPEKQTCCGQPAFNSGYHDEAASLAQKLLRDFRDAVTIVAPSASCVAMIRKHYAALKLDDTSLAELEQMTPRLFELSEFLVDEMSITDVNAPAFPHRVAYHTSCHGFRDLGIYDQPLSLLRNVPAIEVVEPEDLHACCGFGGTFAVKFQPVSEAMGEDKLEAVIETNVDILTATDDSCLMHLGGMVEKRGLPIRPLHYARILAGGEVLL